MTANPASNAGEQMMSAYKSPVRYARYISIVMRSTSSTPRPSHRPAASSAPGCGVWSAMRYAGAGLRSTRACGTTRNPVRRGVLSRRRSADRPPALKARLRTNAVCESRRNPGARPSASSRPTPRYAPHRGLGIGSPVEKLRALGCDPIEGMARIAIDCALRSVGIQ
jgi:hypothetical protein